MSAREMRSWAKANGHRVGDRGPIPRAIQNHYDLAHQISGQAFQHPCFSAGSLGMGRQSSPFGGMEALFGGGGYPAGPFSDPYGGMGMNALAQQMGGLDFSGYSHPMVFQARPSSSRSGSPSHANSQTQRSGSTRSASASLERPSSQSSTPVNVPQDLKKFLLEECPSIELGVMLGQGKFGKVYKGKYKGDAVAIKVVDLLNPKDLTRQELIEFVTKEIGIVKKLRHTNIVPVLGIWMNSDEIWIVMELASSNLRSFIERKRGAMDPTIICRFAKQIADALDYCISFDQNTKIYHHDLKTENILVMNDSQVKVADFGFARERIRRPTSSFSSRVSSRMGQAGTIYWQAPEIHHKVCKNTSEDQPIGHRGELSDVYSFGLILWSMATGSYPFIDLVWEDIISRLHQGRRPPIVRGKLNPVVEHLIRACWRQNYKLRPSFSSISNLLARCVSGNIDSIRSEELQRMVPIRYSPMRDMFTGELYEFLVEQGIEEKYALKFVENQETGRLFMSLEVRDFVSDYGIPADVSHKLESLKSILISGPGGFTIVDPSKQRR